MQFFQKNMHNLLEYVEKISLTEWCFLWYKREKNNVNLSLVGGLFIGLWAN